jgi:hypothetical protein
MAATEVLASFKTSIDLPHEMQSTQGKFCRRRREVEETKVGAHVGDFAVDISVPERRSGGFRREVCEIATSLVEEYQPSCR